MTRITCITCNHCILLNIVNNLNYWLTHWVTTWTREMLAHLKFSHEKEKKMSFSDDRPMEVGSVWVQRLKMTVFIFSCCYQDRNWGPIILKSFPCPLLVQVESPRGCCCYQQWFTVVAWNTRIAFHIDGMRQKVIIWVCLCSYFHLSFRDMSTKRRSECLLLLLHICGARTTNSFFSPADGCRQNVTDRHQLQTWAVGEAR